MTTDFMLPNGPIPDRLRNDRTPSDPSHPADSLRHSLAVLCSERLKAAERGGKLCCFVLRNTAVSGHGPPADGRTSHQRLGAESLLKQPG